MIFLIDGNKEYSYQDLLEGIDGKDSYVPMMRTKDLFYFYTNMIRALVSNYPLVLIDADINASEIDGIDESEVNKASPVKAVNFQRMTDVLDAVKQSSSTITIFTSGTTGQPKKVIHTISSLTRAVRIGDKYKGQVWGFAYNPTHMAGLQVFFQGFYNLNAFINVFGKSRNDVLSLIDNWKVTHISATPTFYRLLLPYEKPYTSVVRATLGGEKSDEALYANVKKVFPNAKITN